MRRVRTVADATREVEALAARMNSVVAAWAQRAPAAAPAVSPEAQRAEAIAALAAIVAELRAAADVELAQAADWARRAERAVLAARDDLALQALGRQSEHADIAARYADEADRAEMAWTGALAGARRAAAR